MALRRIYEFDLKLLIVRLLPPDLRGKRMVDWLRALLAPLYALHLRSLDAHRDNLKRANWNPGRMAMEQLLNDLYDEDLRNFRVVNDADLSLPEFLFQREEGKPPEYLFYRSESWPTVTYWEYRSERTSQPDCKIEVPWYAHQAILERIKGTVESLLVAGVQYEIVKTYPAIGSGVSIPTY